MDNEGHKDSIINKGTISCRSDSTKCNISQISKNEGYKKGQMVMIVGSGRGTSDIHERVKEHVKQMQKDMDKMKVTLINLGEAGRAGASAGLALSEALKKMHLICPDDMIHVMDNMDFSKVEQTVLDSFGGYGGPKFPGRCYDESGPISKKAYKKLKQLAKKRDRANARSHKQDQTDRWCNKWDKKIKRKLK